MIWKQTIFKLFNDENRTMRSEHMYINVYVIEIHIERNKLSAFTFKIWYFYHRSSQKLSLDLWYLSDVYFWLKEFFYEIILSEYVIKNLKSYFQQNKCLFFVAHQKEVYFVF